MATTDKTSPPATAALPPHIAAMTQPGFYPEAPATVAFHQTHISYLFFTSDKVYKVKKAVRFPFLDACALRTRLRLCFDEVRLNRRLAPDVYVGVRPIVSAAGGFAFRPAMTGPDEQIDDSVVEYAVEMQRLPEARMLDRMVKEGAAGVREIHQIANQVAAFHRTASTANSARYGSADAVSRMVARNLKECERFEGYTLSQAQLCALFHYVQQFAGENWKLLNRRCRNGRVREGHGDVRCEHVCLDGGTAIFDCVEFSEELRYGDVASEISFLVMDLDRLGAAELASEFVARYIEVTGDRELELLLPYYKCYRAVVRGKVESLRSLDLEIDPTERASARAAASSHFAQACVYALCYDGRPVVVAVCGLPATGKTTTARLLGQRLGFEVLSSDETRKRLAGTPPATSFKAPYGQGIYIREFTAKTYSAMFDAASALLQNGRGVIFDATFHDPAQRKQVMQLATRSKVQALFVECHAPEREVLRRLAERSQHPGAASDAGVEVYLRQRAELVPLDELPTKSLLRVETTHKPEEAIAAVERRLAQLCWGK